MSFYFPRACCEAVYWSVKLSRERSDAEVLKAEYLLSVVSVIPYIHSGGSPEAGLFLSLLNVLLKTIFNLFSFYIKDQLSAFHVGESQICWSFLDFCCTNIVLCWIALLKGIKGFNYDTVIFGCARNSEKRRETIISSNQDMLTIIPSAMQVLKFLLKPHELPKFDNLYHLEQKNSIQS